MEGYGLAEMDVNKSLNVTKDVTSTKDIDALRVFLLSIIMVCSFSGNVLVIGVLVARSEMRTRTNLFFANLSIVGVCCSLTSMVLMMMGLASSDQWLWQDDLCQINYFLWQVWLTECVFTLIALSVHKYLSVIIPLKRYINRKRTIILLACTWMMASLVAAAPVIGWRKISYKAESSVCFYSDAFEPLHISHVVSIICINYLLPVVAVIIIYCRVFRAINHHRSRIHKTGIIDDIGIRAKKRLVITICIILIIFYLCWIPLCICDILTLSINHISSQLLSAAFYCGFLFYILFPITLAIRNPRFKRGFVDILTCKYFKKDTRPDLGLSFSSSLSNTNSAFEFLEERRCSVWYMSTQKSLLSLETVPPERRLKLRWIETNL